METVNDLIHLLAACRANRDDVLCRQAMLDRVQDDDGVPPVSLAAAVLGMKCERCGCPDCRELVARDARGGWQPLSRVEGMNHYEGTVLFDGDDPEWQAADLAFYRDTRWHLVCPRCRRSLVSLKAHATRKANREAELNLFTGVE